MQAMERKSGIEPEFTREMTRWLIAAGIAAVALMGLFTLLAAIVFFVEVPGWVQSAGGIGVAIGAAAFAWLVASALGSSRSQSGETRRSAQPTDIRTRR
jgi:membrane protein implicated in regulation of membrane protease activity